MKRLGSFGPGATQGRGEQHGWSSAQPSEGPVHSGHADMCSVFLFADCTMHRLGRRAFTLSVCQEGDTEADTEK